MPDPIMYQEDAYVVLESGHAEQILTPDELLTKLMQLLAEHPDVRSPELMRFSDPTEQARHLMETTCELAVSPGAYLQWYVVRLEK